jgi:hypothetical protein
MAPAWVMTSIVVVLGCLGALVIGYGLPANNFDPWLSLALIAMAAACVLCAVCNNFPFLLALGSWAAFFPHLPVIGALGSLAIMSAWMAGVLFFRLCLKGYLEYRQSFNWLVLIAFAWVPIRFLMNPVRTLGVQMGGTGVSGAMPYYYYLLAAALLIFIGAVLTDRAKVIYYMRWSFIVAFIGGTILLICAFIPATGPFLVAMGSFAAGNITEGVQRLVQLPGYGLFIVQAALCPALFRLKGWQCIIVFLLGMAMIIVGGNRCASAQVVIVVPVILFLRGSSRAFILSACLMVAAVMAVHVTVSNMTTSEIPTLLRSFGTFDSRIDKATGADLSAGWRYAVWQDGINKIMESPLVGKGFGNLPQHLEPNAAATSTDFETVLAGGEAHNGFVTAAYGFGIPFMVILSVTLFFYLFKECALALTTDKHDQELRDLHAFLGGSFCTIPISIYTFADLSTSMFWVFVAISCILSRLPRHAIYPAADAGSPLRRYGEESRPVAAYRYGR